MAPAPRRRSTGGLSLATLAAAGLAVATLAAAFHYGVFVAAGADSYGYVSQAALWTRGVLRVPQPIVDQVPELTDDMVAPLGYRPAEMVGLHGGIVPTYAPGLPLIMAGCRLVGGRDAVYIVVPILAALTVWLTFVLGRRLRDDTTGVFGALLIATSPVLIGSAVRPMSDVPVAAWWTLALVSAAGRGATRAAVAGLATSLAVLTRPNLLALGVVIGLPFLVDVIGRRPVRQGAVRRFFAFGTTAAMGPTAVALINRHLYGSPFRSGYGAVEAIYSTEFVSTNIARYSRWLMEAQTPLVLIGLAAPLLIAFDRQHREEGDGTWSVARLSWVSLTLFVVTVLSYLAYLPFDDWSYLRFLLPGFPALFALSSFVIVSTVARLPRAAAVAVIAGLACLLAWRGLAETRGRHVFGWANDERRYASIGKYIDEHLPLNAVLLAMQHSGSARYYSERTTIRYDMIEPSKLDPLMSSLVRRGLRPYFLLEAWEADEFRERFGQTSEWGVLDWAPLAETDTPTVVRLYDPRDRGASPSRGSTTTVR